MMENKEKEEVLILKEYHSKEYIDKLKKEKNLIKVILPNGKEV